MIHAPGFYDFALQNLFHARSRAAAEISESRLAYSYNLQGKVVICKEKAPTPNKKGTPKACLSASLRDAAHTRCALFPPNLAFGKEGGQACRSRPHKIPRKSQGVYLTFTPLPAPRRRGLVRRADERGLSPPVSPEPGAYLKGDSVPLRPCAAAQDTCTRSPVSSAGLRSPRVPRLSAGNILASPARR